MAVNKKDKKMIQTARWQETLARNGVEENRPIDAETVRVVLPASATLIICVCRKKFTLMSNFKKVDY